uniref:Uncharacterized protein n=1 Tax=Triticum urartu TaxID=4572 RepID=A0A8R7U7Y6_TRIUA
MRRAPISSTTADASSSSELTLYAPSAGAGRGSQTQRAACIGQHVQNNTLQGTAARRRAVAATCSAASMTLMNLL